MIKLYIDKTTFYLGDKVFDFNNLFTLEYYHYCDSKVNQFDLNSFATNILYNVMVMPYLALCHFVETEKIDYLSVKNNRALELYAHDIAQKKLIKCNNSNFWLKLKIVISFHIVFTSSALYLFFLMLRIPYTREEVDVKGDFSVQRTNSGKSKMSRFSVPYEIEDPHSKTSIYRLFPKRKRLGWVLSSWLHSWTTIKDIRHKVSGVLGNDSSYKVFSFYQERIVHVLLYGKVMDAYMKVQSGKTYYTTNNLDHYSIVEEEIADKYGINTICIPHGLEYGFKFPKGFSCKLFYTNSKYAADFLNGLYDTKKFFFDIDVANTMFRVLHRKTFERKNLVFFTEPRCVYVNQQIIRELKPMLDEKKIQLNLKLHPFDNLSDYEMFNCPIIKDLNDAVCDNVCFSRKSTTLLEASYNGSAAAAILINEKDKSTFYTFPSLQSERITVTESIPELFNWICKQFDV